MNDLASAPADSHRTPPRPHRAPTINVAAHLGLVAGIAARVARHRRLDLASLSVDDLISIGSEALIAAAARFDPDRSSFATFAYHRAHGAMLDALRANGCYRRRRSADRQDSAAVAVTVSLEANEATCLGVPDDRDPPDEVADTHRQIQGIRDAIARLPAGERRLIEGHYLDGRSLDELGAEIGASRSWTCRQVRRAVARLRRDYLGEAAGR